MSLCFAFHKYTYVNILRLLNINMVYSIYKWRPPRQSELTPYQIKSELTHLGSEAFKYNGEKSKVNLK